MGKLLGIENVGGELVGIFPVELAEHVLIALFTGSQNDHLDRILREHLLQNIGNQVKALLIRQSGYNTNHHLLVIHGQTEFFLQCTFIL